MKSTSCFFGALAVSLVGLVGCSSASPSTAPSDGDTVVEESAADAALRTAAREDTSLKHEMRELRTMGWVVATVADATIEHVDVPATDDAAATTMARLVIPAVKDAARADVLFARGSDGGAFEVAVRPTNEDGARELAVDGDAPSDPAAAPEQTGDVGTNEAALGKDCVSRCRYISKRGTNFVCFDNTMNPFAQYYYFTVRVRAQGPAVSCNDMTRTWNGCGVLCPDPGSGSSVFVCGRIPNTKSCTGF